MKYIWPFLLGIIVIGGLTLRLCNLDGPSFIGDELFHVFAAEKILEGKGPLLPSGYLYSRSLLFTYLVAFSTFLGSFNEFSARLPAALIGTLTIIAVFYIGRRWYSTSAGLIAALLTSLTPLEIFLSRQVRFYTAFQLLYILFLFILFHSLDSQPINSRLLGKRICKYFNKIQLCPFLLMASAILFALSYHLQSLSIVGLVGPAFYVLILAFLAPFIKKMLLPRKKKFYILGTLIIVAGIVAILTPSTIEKFTEVNTHIPSWAQKSWHYYHDRLVADYPIVFGSFLIMALIALIKNPKATLYLVTCFAVPIAVQSLFFELKHIRYIFHLIPIMYIVSGAGISIALKRLYKQLSKLIAANVKIPHPQISAAFLILGAASCVFTATPWLAKGITLHRLEIGISRWNGSSQWRETMHGIQPYIKPADVVICSLPALAMYYNPTLKNLYQLNNQTIRLNSATNMRDASGNLLDYSSGAQCIENLEQLKQILKSKSRAWFISEKHRLRNDSYYSIDIKRYMKNCFKSVEISGVEDMVVWQLNEWYN